MVRRDRDVNNGQEYKRELSVILMKKIRNSPQTHAATKIGHYNTHDWAWQEKRCTKTNTHAPTYNQKIRSGSKHKQYQVSMHHS